jgi:hypothetical protein
MIERGAEPLERVTRRPVGQLARLGEGVLT